MNILFSEEATASGPFDDLDLYAYTFLKYVHVGYIQVGDCRPTTTVAHMYVWGRPYSLLI